MTIYIKNHRHQQGFTLLEALIAFVVLAGGLLAAFRFHSTTMEGVAEAKISSQATALAEQKIEEFRAFQDGASLALSLAADGQDAANAFDGDGYAAGFTRAWTVAGTNPREVTVTVGWTDRRNQAQSIQLSSMIWQTEPLASGSQLASAVLYDGDPGGGWPGGGGGEGRTGVGTGTVEITLTDPIIVDDPENPDMTMTQYTTYRIDFTGSIEFTDDGLESAPDRGVGLINGGTHSTAACPLLAEGAEEYSCAITGVPAGETWSGTIVFYPDGNDAVCDPSDGEADLTFTEASASDDTPLGATVLTNNGACH